MQNQLEFLLEHWQMNCSSAREMIQSLCCENKCGLRKSSLLVRHLIEDFDKEYLSRGKNINYIMHGENMMLIKKYPGLLTALIILSLNYHQLWMESNLGVFWQVMIILSGRDPKVVRPDALNECHIGNLVDKLVVIKEVDCGSIAPAIGSILDTINVCDRFFVTGLLKSVIGMTSQPYWAYGTSEDASQVMYEKQPVLSKEEVTPHKQDKKPYVPEGYKAPKETPEVKEEPQKEKTKDTTLLNRAPEGYSYMSNTSVNRQVSDYFVNISQADSDRIAAIIKKEASYA